MINFDGVLARRKVVAQIIFDNPFRSGFTKLKRSDLYDIINLLAQAYTEKVDDMYFEYDLKDMSFAEKCNICELLDENFFKNKE